MEYYWTIKRNKVLIHATTWMNLENIMLSEGRQSQKTTYYMTAFIRKVKDRQIYRDRKQINQGLPRGGGGEEWGVTVNIGFLPGVTKMFKTNCGDGCTTL